MTNDLLELWFTRLDRSATAATLPPAPPLAIKIDEARCNVLIVGAQRDATRRRTLEALRHLALRDARLDGKADITGWLVIDVPVPNRIDATGLVHRMIRRLYFAAVLHGLAEIPAFRDAVHSLRMSYWQTRGNVTTGSSNEDVIKGGGELELSFNPFSPLKGKLTASEEVKVVESLATELQRLTLLEAEDQLLYDLALLTQLNALVDQYAALVKVQLPRWEVIRNFFRAAYSVFKDKKTFRLRPVFVLEALSPTSLAAVMAFLSDAAALANAQGAQLIVLGNELLKYAWDADQELGHAVFRDVFDRVGDGQASLAKVKAEAYAGILGKLVDPNTKADLPFEVLAVLERMGQLIRPT